MGRYYTRACNFTMVQYQRKKLKKNYPLPLHGNKLVSFDTIEIISRKSTKRINLKKVSKLQSQIKKNIIRY